MFQIARSCQVEGHKGKSPTHICLFQECQNIMVCQECQQQGYHQHEQTNDNHIMDKQQFLNYFEKQIIDVPQFTNIPPEQIENNLIQINQIIDQAKELKFQLEQENQIRQTIKQIQMIAKQDFLLINKQQIIFINHFKQMLHSSSDKSLQIYSQLMIQVQQLYFQEYPKKQGFQEQLKENTNEQIQSSEAHAKLINIQHQNYTKYYEFYQFTPMWALQISQDEQFLAFGSSDNKMNLLDLQNKQLIENNIKLNSIACICRFSDDSSLLFIGDKDGMLYSYNVHDQRLVYSKKTHNGIIYNIILIDNFNIITCSQDITIAVTDIQNDNIRRFQNIHNHHIYALDYDNQKDTIISGSWDKSIKVINRQDGLILIQQENAHKDFVQQLQVTQRNTLISRSLNQLIIWKVDYQNSQLKQLHHLEVQNSRICNISSSFEFIVMITHQEVKILDHNLNVTQLIKHDNDAMNNYSQTLQLYSMNYLIIPGTTKFQVLQTNKSE